MIIRDGTGDAHRAQVDMFNRLRTFTTMTTQEHHATTINVAFVTAVSLSGVDSLTLGAGFNGYILALKNNNPQRFMNIQKIVVSSDTSGVNFVVVRNPEFGTLSNNNQVAPAQLNFGSEAPANAEGHVWDEVGSGIGGITGGTSIGSYIVRDEVLPLPTDGSIAVNNGNILAIRAVNGSGGPVEVTAEIRNFFEG
jgi:hypothetical protein